MQHPSLLQQVNYEIRPDPATNLRHKLQASGYSEKEIQATIINSRKNSYNGERYELSDTLSCRCGNPLKQCYLCRIDGMRAAVDKMAKMAKMAKEDKEKSCENKKI